MREISKIYRLLKRRCLQAIDKNYIKNKLKKRKGKCQKCGRCCIKCRHLDKKTNLCKVYNSRPWHCYKEFPLDKRDLELWNVEKVCGYKFENRD